LCTMAISRDLAPIFNSPQPILDRYTELNNALQEASRTVSTIDPAIISAAMKRKRQYRPRVSQNRPRTSPNGPRTSRTSTPARPGAVMDITMPAITQHRLSELNSSFDTLLHKEQAFPPPLPHMKDLYSAFFHRTNELAHNIVCESCAIVDHDPTLFHTIATNDPLLHFTRKLVRRDLTRMRSVRLASCSHRSCRS